MKDNSKKTKKLKFKSAKQKTIIVGLSVALGLVGTAAIVAPTMVSVLKKGGGGGGSEPTAKWHTVTFDTAGGSTVKQQTVKDGEYATRPVDPTKDGYSFAGWYTDNTYTTSFNFDSPITADTKIWGNWGPKVVTSVTVTCKANGHGTFSGQTVTTVATEKGTAFKSVIKPGITVDEDWAHIGWVDDNDQEIDPDTPIINNLTIKAKYKEHIKTNTLNLSSDAGGSESWNKWDVSVKGLTTYNLSHKDYTKYSDIKSQLPTATCEDVDDKAATFLYWSKTQQTDTTVKPTEVPDTDVIKDNDVLYPVFDFSTKSVPVYLWVQPINDSYHTQTYTGSLTLYTTYNEDAGENNTKFKDLNKPQIYESGKVFSGYYKTYNNGVFSDPWDNEEILSSNASIYVKMVDASTDLSVTFDKDPSLEKDCTWVGNQTLKVEKDTLLGDIAAPNVYYDATVNPTPDLGFITDWYFKGWYRSTDETKTLLESNEKFETSCTLYPKFAKKTNVVFQTNKPVEGGTVVTTSSRYVPSTKWTEVVKPETISGLEGNDVFLGWQYTSKSGTEILLDDTCKIEDIPLLTGDDPTTQTIVPYIGDLSTCHTFEFQDTARISGTTTTTSVTLVGADTGYVDFGDGSFDIPVNSWLNKPLVPKKRWNETIQTWEAINSDYSFENEWEISTDSSFPTESTYSLTDFTITAGTSKTTYYVRPVVIKDATVTFSAGDYGDLEAGSVSTIKASPTTTFANLYKPNVIPKSGSGKIFSYWADENGNKIESTHTFTDTENVNKLHAVYDDENVPFSINFKVSDYDMNDSTFPVEPYNDENKFQVQILDAPTATHVFSDFARWTPTKACHKLKGWTKEWKGEKGEESVLLEETANIPSGGSGLDLYAVFEETGTYHEITIAPWSGTGTEYTVEGDSLIYALDGSNPINSLTKQFEVKEGNTTKFQSNVWAVGKKLTGWKTADGEDLPTEIDKDYLNVVPQFADADDIEISFKSGDDYTLSSTTTSFVKVHDKLSNYISLENWAPIATKTKATFSKWAIYVDDETDPTAITDDYRVTAPITLVPTFMDESIFEGSSDAYYYDEDAKMWAAIKTYYDEDYPHRMTVYYQDGTEGYADKLTFNYEIKFGSQMTKIPDYFMYGCTNWNNGGQPLYFPKQGAETSMLSEIGKSVMYGCTSFNQPISILANTQNRNVEFKVGPNFMRGCSSFNKDINITFVPKGEGKEQTEGSIAISDGFMFECNSFTKTVSLPGWSDFGYMTWSGDTLYDSDIDETNFYSCLSTTDLNYLPFTIDVDEGMVSLVQNLFPSLTGKTSEKPYCWTYRSVTVQ